MSIANSELSHKNSNSENIPMEIVGISSREEIYKKGIENLKDSKFRVASDIFQYLISNFGEKEEYLIGKLLADTCSASIEDLNKLTAPFEKNPTYISLLSVCSEEKKAKLITANIEAKNNLLNLINKKIKKHKWKDAIENCKIALEIYPENEDFLLANFLADVHCTNLEKVKRLKNPINDRTSYGLLINSCSNETKKKLQECNEIIGKRTNAKKHRKRIIIISLAIVFIAIASVIAVLIYRSSDKYIYGLEKTENGYIVTTYRGNETEIEIPSKYKGKPIVEISKNAFFMNSDLKSVVIPDSVTIIGDWAFSDCESLTSIVIGNGVTSISKWTFANCKSLTSIVIGNGVTSIGESAFYNCTSLTSVVIGNSVTSVGEWAFCGCKSLTSVVIGNGVTSIGDGAFSRCISLTSIEIPDSITSIGYIAFSGCESLTSITAGENNNCYKSIDGNLYSKDGKALIQYAPGKKETSFTIPNGVTRIGDGAFYGCTGLTSIKIGDSVTSIGYGAFDNCNSSTYNEYDNGLYLGNDENPYFAFVKVKDKNITSCDINEKTKIIAEAAFDECKGLTSIVIPDSVTNISDGAFLDCENLKKVYITDIKAWCEIDFESFLSNPLYYADELYLNNELLSGELVIPDGVTKIGTCAFFGCAEITSVSIPNSVTSIGEEAFCYCTNLTSIEIPNSVTSIGSYAFLGCENLKKVYITDIKAWCEIDFKETSSSPLFYADELYLNNELISGELIIPDGVTKIGTGAFWGYDELTSIIIPNSVTSIGEEAFLYCTNLTIYCEAQEKPSGWDSNWNPDNRPVEWGYKNKKIVIKKPMMMKEC